MAYKMKGFSGFKSSPVKKGTLKSRKWRNRKQVGEDLSTGEKSTSENLQSYKKEQDAKMQAQTAKSRKYPETAKKVNPSIYKPKLKPNTPKTLKKPLRETHESSTPVKHADTPYHKINWDKVQTGLSVAGMAPGLGVAPDLINTGISGARAIKARLKGDKKGAKKHIGKAGMNLVSAVPGPGDAVGAKSISDDLGYGKKDLKWKENIPEKGWKDLKKSKT